MSARAGTRASTGSQQKQKLQQQFNHKLQQEHQLQHEDQLGTAAILGTPATAVTRRTAKMSTATNYRSRPKSRPANRRVTSTAASLQWKGLKLKTAT